MSQMKAIIDQLMSNVSSAYVPDGYISEKIFPFVGVKESTGKLAKYGTNHLRIELSVKGGRGAYRRVEPIVRSNTGYSIEGHGLEGMVTKEDKRNVPQPYDAEQDEALGLTSLLWLDKEYGLATALASTSTLSQNVTLSTTSQWSDYSNSDPLDDSKTARHAIKDGCGKMPDTVFMDIRTADTLRYHPQILDFLGYKFARPGGLSDEEIAKALGVKRALIADVDYESAKEGQTSDLAAVWGKHCWFGVLPESAQKMQVSGGYRVGYAGEMPRKVYKYDINNPPESTAILVEDNYDFLLSNVNALYLIKDAIA